MQITFQNQVGKSSAISTNYHDKSIHQKFVKFGNDRRKLTNELLALLPEIYEKRIYKKYASSIVEYAAKFGGLTENVVKKRLRLEKHLENKPMLKDAIRSEGINKVAIMATLVNPENEEAMVDKIKNMSKPALQELAKELRAKHKGVGMFGQSGVEDEIEGTFCKAIPAKLTIELDEEMTFMFLQIKKQFGNQLSNKEVMAKILKMKVARNVKITTSTSIKAIPGDSEASLADSVASLADSEEEAKAKSRYIPAKNKKLALQKTNGHCAYPNCNRPPEVFHHTDRFDTSHSHKSIQPLCKIHHEFMHNGVIDNEQFEIKMWQLNLKNNKNIQPIDQLYRSYRS
ncbi:MAG: hypothetical protein AAB373_05130 [Patescibacteria group bacterium]